LDYIKRIASNCLSFYKNSDKEALFFCLTNYILVILAVFLIIKSSFYHYNLISTDIQLEFREGAQLVFTQNLLDGKSPYAIENQPQAYYVYGPIYNLVVYPFAKVFGNTFSLHRIISGFFITCSIFLFYYLCRQIGFNLGFSLAVSAILYEQLLFRTTPLARPDGLGFFLFLSAIAIFALKSNFKTKIIYACIALILAFFTKQYFALGFIIIGASLVFISLRSLFLFVILSMLGIAVPLILLAYNTDMFIPSFIFNSLNSFKPDTSHLIKQINIYITNYYSLLSGYLGLLIFLFFHLKQTHIRDTFLRVKKSPISSNINPNNIIFIICAVGLLISTGFLVLKLGRHVGANMIYFYQLLTIFLIVLSGYLLRLKYLRLILIIVLAVNIFTVIKHKNTKIGSSEDWKTLKSEICANDQVLNNPAVVGLMIECGKKVWASGQSRYLRRGVHKYSPNISRKVKNKFSDYKTEIEMMVKTRKFDLILTTRNKKGDGFWNQNYFAYSLVSKHYNLTDTVKVRLSYQKYSIELWKPKP